MRSGDKQANFYIFRREVNVTYSSLYVPDQESRQIALDPGSLQAFVAPNMQAFGGRYTLTADRTAVQVIGAVVLPRRSPRLWLRRRFRFVAQPHPAYHDAGRQYSFYANAGIPR